VFIRYASATEVTTTEATTPEVEKDSEVAETAMIGSMGPFEEAEGEFKTPLFNETFWPEVLEAAGSGLKGFATSATPESLEFGPAKNITDFSEIFRMEVTAPEVTSNQEAEVLKTLILAIPVAMWLWAVTGYVGAWAFEKLVTRIERSLHRCKFIFW
jgi:hypothetical protein